MAGPEVELYTVQHLTLREIAAQLGVTRQTIWARLRRAGIAAHQGEHVRTVCAYCTAPLTVLRGRWRLHRRVFCSQAHYLASRLTPGAVVSRAGCLRARALVRTFFDLLPEHVVHHLDHDETHNALSNLVVYASHADHMSAHHGSEVLPIWRGAEMHGPVRFEVRRAPRATLPLRLQPQRYGVGLNGRLT